jgi:hypothetical protein
MNNKAVNTGRSFNIGGFIINEVTVESCYRLSQYGMGLPITCACTICKAKGQTPEEAKKRMDFVHGKNQ